MTHIIPLFDQLLQRFMNVLFEPEDVLLGEDMGYDLTLPGMLGTVTDSAREKVKKGNQS